MKRIISRKFLINLLVTGFLLVGFSLLAHGVYAQNEGVEVAPSQLGFRVPNLSDVLTFFIRFFFVIAGLVALIYLLLGAFAWITSAGDKEAVTAAREKITNAIIGVILIVAVLAVVVTLEQIVFQKRVCFGISCAATIPGLVKGCVPAPNDDSLCCKSGYAGYAPDVEFSRQLDSSGRIIGFSYPSNPGPYQKTYTKQCCWNNYGVSYHFSALNPNDERFCSTRSTNNTTYTYQP